MPKNNETTYRPFHYSKLHVDDTILVDFVISLQDFDYMDQQAQNDVGLPLVELAACDSVRAYNIAKFGLCRAFNAASHPTTPGYSANQHYSPGVARALQLSDFRDHLPNWRQQSIDLALSIYPTDEDVEHLQLNQACPIPLVRIAVKR